MDLVTINLTFAPKCCTVVLLGAVFQSTHCMPHWPPVVEAGIFGHHDKLIAMV